MTSINHDEPYSDDYLQDILASVQTIAMAVSYTHLTLPTT